MQPLFWNIDTQKDFILPTGKLYIKGAEDIIPNLNTLTTLAKKHKIKVVNTGDYHTPKDKEISDKPDFKETFPEHCIIGTEGMEFIHETYPKEQANYVIVSGDDKEIDEELLRVRNIVIYKNAFDVFQGNKYTEEVLRQLNPDQIFVYGVATNVCVNQAVLGLLQRKKDVVIVRDAIKELPGSSSKQFLDDWQSKGADILSTRLVEYLFNQKVS